MHVEFNALILEENLLDKPKKVIWLTFLKFYTNQLFILFSSASGYTEIIIYKRKTNTTV